MSKMAIVVRVLLILTIALQLAAGQEDILNVSKADLEVANTTLESYVKELEAVLGQIRGAFTSTQFDEVHRRMWGKLPCLLLRFSRTRDSQAIARRIPRQTC